MVAGQRARVVTERPGAALGLAVGPVAFVTAWAVGGARTPGYSPVSDAISRIAAVGAPERTTMTLGFVAYGIAVGVGATALRRSNLPRTWGLAAINAAATLAVAATPLERSDAVDRWHGVAAAVGYASITALPAVAAPTLRRLGARRAAVASVAIAATSAACLVATTLGPGKGALQRTGLLAGDVWLVAMGIALWRSGRDEPPAPASSTP